MPVFRRDSGYDPNVFIKLFIGNSDSIDLLLPCGTVISQHPEIFWCQGSRKKLCVKCKC